MKITGRDEPDSSLEPPFKFQTPTAIDNEEILLLLVIHVADAREEESGDGVLLSA